MMGPEVELTCFGSNLFWVIETGFVLVLVNSLVSSFVQNTQRAEPRDTEQSKNALLETRPMQGYHVLNQEA